MEHKKDGLDERERAHTHSELISQSGVGVRRGVCVMDKAAAAEAVELGELAPVRSGIGHARRPRHGRVEPADARLILVACAEDAIG